MELELELEPELALELQLGLGVLAFIAGSSRVSVVPALGTPCSLRGAAYAEEDQTCHAWRQEGAPQEARSRPGCG